MALLPAIAVSAISSSGYYTSNNIHTYDPSGTALGCSSPNPAGTAPATGDLKSFIDAYAAAAFSVGRDYGIPYEAILAQAALESGYGKSQLTVQAYNFFGMKAGSKWDGPVIYFNTKEQDSSGNEYVVSAAFRVYASAEAGFQGYGEFITGSSRYAQALEYPTDYINYIIEIKKAGYATDVKYVDKVTNIANAIAVYIKEKGLFPPSGSLTTTQTPPQGSTSTPISGQPINCAATSPTQSVSSSEAVARIIATAQQELALRPVEYDSNVLKYSDGNKEAWCADFVSWVHKEAGVSFTGGASGGWRIASVLSLQSWFKQNAIYIPVGSQPPQPGDVAFYIGAQTPDGGSNQHVNIVISVSGNTMTTIGGNESNMVKQSTRTVALGYSGLVGFGRLK